MAAVLLLSAAGMAGCAETAEQEITEGVEEARAVFEQDSPAAEELEDGTELFLPDGYELTDSADNNTITLLNGEGVAVLEFNPNESENSRYFYDMLAASEDAEWLAAETFEYAGRFGFVAVGKAGEDRFEVIAGTGDAQLTGFAGKGDIEEQLTEMMKIVRSADAE